MNPSKEVLDLAEKLQDECQKQAKIIADKYVTGEIGTKANYAYQDSVNVWLYQKLAEYELRIRELEDRRKDLSDSFLRCAEGLGGLEKIEKPKI